MSRRGFLLALLRVLVFALILTGLIALPHWLRALPFWIAAIAIYGFWPRPALPDRALCYEWATAIAGPDWIGFLFGGTLTVLPIWIARAESEAGLIHPVAFLVWPIAMILLALPVIGWRNDAYHLVLSSQSFTVHGGSTSRTIRFDAVVKVKPWQRGLPHWLRYLVPFLVASGHYSQAGALLLARDSSGVELELKSGQPVVIKADGFEAPTRALMAQLKLAGTPMARGLSRYLPKSPRKTKPE